MVYSVKCGRSVYAKVCLLENHYFRLLCAFFSILLMCFVSISIQGVKTITVVSIYHRYPALVVVLVALWSLAFWGKYKLLELFSYVFLYGLLVYRSFFEMKNLVSDVWKMFNENAWWTWGEYTKVALSFLLFLLTMYMLVKEKHVVGE